MDRVSKVILRGDVGDLIGKLKATSSAVRSTVSSMTDGTREAATWRQGLSAVGDSAGKMGLAVSAGLVLVAKAAIDWETAWAGVTKTVNGSASQMAELEDGLRGLAKTLPSSHKDIAAVAEAAGQLGVKRKDIVSFTKTMIDLSQTTNLSADEAATSIAQLSNVMGVAPGDIDNLGAALVALGNAGASTERDIVQMAQRIAGAGKTVGLSASDVLAISNAVASLGIDVEAGGTAVSTVLAKMSQAAVSGGAKLTSFANTAGMSADQFAAAFKAKPAEALVAFTKGLGRTQKAGGDLYAQLRDVGLSDIRVSQALIGMASSGDLLTDSLKTGSNAWRANTALAAEAEKRYNTTASKIQVSWNKIKDSAIDAGETMLPLIAEATDVVGGMADAFGRLPGPAKSGLTAVGGIAAVSLLVVAGTAKMITSIAATRLALDQLALSGTRAGTAMTVFARAGAGLAAFWAGAALGDKVGERNSKAIDKMTESLLRFSKTGKVDGDLGDLFGEDLGGKSVRFGKDLGSIGEALKSLAGYADDNSLTEALKFFGSAGQSAGITAQAEALGDLDKSFTSLARNKPDAAIAAFEKLRDRALETGAGAKDVAAAFPEMTSLLKAASESMGGTSDESKILAGNLADLAPAAQQSATEIKAAQDALDKARQSTIDAAMAFDGFAQNLDPKKMGFTDYIKSLEDMARAQADWADNLVVATNRGVDEGVIQKFQEMGPEGAKRLAELADASDKEIARVNDAFASATQTADQLATALNNVPTEAITEFKTAGAKGAIETAADVANRYDLTPDEVITVLQALDYTKADIKAVLARLADLDATTARPKITVDTANAFGAITGVALGLNALKDKTVTVTTRNQTKQATGGEAGLGIRASGSISGPGTGTSDSIPALLSNGEHVLTAAEVQKMGGQDAVYRMRAMVMSGMAPRFASGGAVTKASKLEIKQAQAEVRDIERSLKERETVGKGKSKHSRLRLRGLDREIAELQLQQAKQDLRDLKSGKAAKDDAAEKRAEAAEAAADAAKQAAEEMASTRLSAKSSFSGNFGISGSSSAAGLSRNLERTLADAKVFVGLLGDLKRQGASPWLLQQLVEEGPTKAAIRLAREYATDSTKLASINAQAAQIDAITGQYAGLVTNPKFSMSGAWNSGVSGGTTQVQIQALDISQLSAEIARQVDHRLSTSAAGGGV